ncbi:DDRGK domain-containing protein [Raphidocelis subcapitata]|uniref:DDRGK domain-containing protein n=1 Tax=Raphidocelis subcapitata TaxID=307507 RepID=A0A2V0NWD0_9CHLO|nr:DDRGK domain-containing protein [Raphidocelis subcapitata]|eukprot:GBF89247.1 DDRGK domain-containing protein [Raphidocelis subcapitata]
MALALLALLVALAAGMAAVVIGLMKMQREAQAGASQAAVAAAADDGAPRAGGRRGGMDRMRAGRLRQRRAAQQAAAGEGSDDDDEDGEEEGGAGGRREARRRDRDEAREAERLAREARENKVNVYEERRRKRDEEREALERAQEEEIRRAAEERARREDEEASKWMGAISVEEAGTGAEGEEGGGEAAAARFVAYVRERKMVSIEELATEFRLRSAEVVERIAALEAQGALTGVMDERGKFIHISAEEMAAVAEFVRKRGRVAIAELAARSGEFIDLEPHAATTAAGGAGADLDFDAVLGEADSGPAAVAAH